jgi:hypothetical protein
MDELPLTSGGNRDILRSATIRTTVVLVVVVMVMVMVMMMGLSLKGCSG